MKKIIFTMLAVYSSLTMAKENSYSLSMDRNILKCDLRIVESAPENKKIIADYFFFIGYGDRADNHAPLFRQLTNEGFRVISFDYPSHGLSKCGSLNNDNYSSLMDYVEEIENKTRQDIKRPIILSGWSTGGLLALRLAQTNRLHNRLMKSLILITPGVSVYPLVGGDGIIRNETLLSNPNPPHMADAKPKSPLLTPLFSSALIANGMLARKEGLTTTPTLIFVADDILDSYAKTPVLKKFVANEKAAGSNLKAIQCQGSRHEMDNEIEIIGSLVREDIVSYALNPLAKLKINNLCKFL